MSRVEDLRRRFRDEAADIEQYVRATIDGYTNRRQCLKLIRDKLHEAYALGKRDGASESAIDSTEARGKLQEFIDAQVDLPEDAKRVLMRDLWKMYL